MIIGERKHTFPSRTRSLSSQPPMVVRPRCRARVGCCQSNEAQVSKEACASLVFHVRTQKFLCEAQKAFGKHNWREPITRRARTARIGVSQPSRRVQRMSGLSCFRVSARTPAVGMHEQGSLGKAPYPLRKAALYFVQLFKSVLEAHCSRSKLQFIVAYTGEMP